MAYIENPFSGYGRVVSGEKFIGREKYNQTVKRRVTDQKEPNNLALIGYPRIGKSSLVQQAVMNLEKELRSERKIPIFINFGAFHKEDAADFFRELVMKAYEYLKEHYQSADRLLRNLYQEIQKNGLDWVDIKTKVERFFEQTAKRNFQFIFVLDEFDYARITFKDNYAGFQELRELAYRGIYKITFVTTSSRSIREIEIQSSANSVLDLLFKKEYLSMYDQSEMAEYFQLYEKIGITLEADNRQRIKYYCGGHPYLLAALGFEVVEAYKENQQFDVDEIFSKIRLDFEDYYEQLITLLKEDGTYEKMLQILFGPMLTVTDRDVKELTDIYGLLEKVHLPGQDESLTAFSQHFQEYLYDLGRKIDFWPLWSELEVRMRALVSKVMEAKFGKDWAPELEKSFPGHLSGAIEKRNKAREDVKSDNLLDYLDAYPLFEIVLSKKYWPDFKDIFGGDKEKTTFEKKIQLIIKIRNPYAHSRFQSISPTTVKQAEIYSAEILEQVNKAIG